MFLLIIWIPWNTIYLDIGYFLEWSKGGILTPSSMVRGATERSDEAFLERSKKRSLLLKNWRVPNPAY